MESYEGAGKARAAWEAAPGDVKLMPSTTAGGGPIGMWARAATEDALGFWLLWHIHGGFDGLRRFGMSRSVIYKRISRFRAGMGQHPDEFTLPGITIDVAEYWKGAAEAEAKRRRLVAEDTRERG